MWALVKCYIIHRQAISHQFLEFFSHFFGWWWWIILRPKSILLSYIRNVWILIIIYIGIKIGPIAELVLHLFFLLYFQSFLKLVTETYSHDQAISFLYWSFGVVIQWSPERNAHDWLCWKLGMFQLNCNMRSLWFSIC